MNAHRARYSAEACVVRKPRSIVSISPRAVWAMGGNGKILMRGYFEVSTGVLREGTNTLQLQTYGGSGDINLTESIKVNYWRKYEANQNRVSFYTANYRTSNVTGFTSPNIRVFDLSYPDNPTLLTNLRIDNNSGNYSVTLPSNRGRSFCVDRNGCDDRGCEFRRNSPTAAVDRRRRFRSRGSGWGFRGVRS